VRATETVEEIENALGKPVVTSNQAMFWQALRTAGCDLPVPGYGRLLR
jgi:maleate isomerase